MHKISKMNIFLRLLFHDCFYFLGLFAELDPNLVKNGFATLIKIRRNTKTVKC